MKDSTNKEPEEALKDLEKSMAEWKIMIEEAENILAKLKN